MSPFWRSITILTAFRRRFVLITVVLVGAVSLVVFGAIGIVAQHDERSEIASALEMAVGQGEDTELPAIGVGSWSSHERSYVGSRTPVYCVTVRGDGSWYENEASTAQMDAERAGACVQAVLDAGANEGVLRDEGVLYLMQGAHEPSGDSFIAFADNTGYEDRIARSYLSLGILWVLLVFAVLVITAFLSRLATQPVEEAWEKQQQFIADASHELKTPLTVIMANASILSTNPDKTVAEQQQWVDGIANEAARMQQLTENMLTLAQADAGADTGELMSRVDLSDLVESSLLQFEAVAFERGLGIDEHIEEGICVNGDSMRLEGLLKTLLENACKYSAKPGTIAVRLHRVKSDAVLEVHNDGTPIPPEDLPHLFDRFYRSDKSRVHEGETVSFGLGLSIAKSTVEMHGGTIGVTSDEQGTTFTAKLPLVR